MVLNDLANALKLPNGTINANDVVYSPEEAFEWIVIGTDKFGKEVTLNNFVLDYVELLWSIYFAIYFGLLGSSLDRFSLFVYSCSMYGFYLHWTQMRENPIFIDPVIFDQYLRVFLSAGMSAIMLRLFRAEWIMQYWQVVTIGIAYAINILDSTFRSRGGCDAELGPPSEHFTLGVWKNCDDWVYAYAITWAYAFMAYAIVLVFAIIGYCGSHVKFLSKIATNGAVAMTATSSAIAALRSGVRLATINDVPVLGNPAILDYTDYVFWSLTFFFFIIQSFVNPFGPSSGCWGCFTSCLLVPSYPMIWVENIIEWIERKVLEMNRKWDESESVEEEEETAEAQRASFAKSRNQKHNPKGKGAGNTYISVKGSRPAARTR